MSLLAFSCRKKVEVRSVAGASAMEYLAVGNLWKMEPLINCVFDVPSRIRIPGEAESKMPSVIMPKLQKNLLKSHTKHKQQDSDRFLASRGHFYP